MSKTNVHVSLLNTLFLNLTTILITIFNSHYVVADLSNVESSFTSDGLIKGLKQIKSDYILDTPFYVYEDLTFPGAFLRDRDGNNIDLESFIKNDHLGGRGRKHSDDYLFMQSALKHPMRVEDPEKAKLFYIPSLMNLISWCHTYEGLNCEYCVDDACNYEVFGVIDKYLGNSEWFQRSDGADHIIVASHYGFNTLWEVDTMANKISTSFAIKLTKDFPNIFKCNKVAFENISQSNIVNRNRVNFPSMYVGKSCEPRNDKRYRFILIADLRRNVERQNIADWFSDGEIKFVVNETDHGEPTKDLIGTHGDFCEEIGYGKYGFHVKGDSFGASRPIDLMLNGVVPIFTEQEQYSILPHWIPFKHLSFFADVKSKSSFMNSLQEIIADEHDEYKMKHDAILEFKELFDHETGIPFDMYMYHFAKKIEKKKFGRKQLVWPSWKSLISKRSYGYKIYEYEAPDGMRPEDLMQCFRKRFSNQNPTVDTLDFPKKPYLPEDLGEWFLHKQIQTSENTTTMEEADYLVVNTMPVLSKYVGKCNGIFHYDRQRIWSEKIHKSKVYQKKPQDHLFICQSWTCFDAVSHEMQSLAYQMTYLIHEPNICWISGKCDSTLKPKHVIIVPYVAHSYLYKPTGKSWVERDYKVSFIGSLHRSTNMREVLKREHVRVLPFLNVIDEGVMDIGNATTMAVFDDYISYMQNSQFCLILEGDTPSSRRLFDAIVSGCIPVFIGSKYSMPFENLIPYDRISIHIDEDEWLKHPKIQLNSLDKINVQKGLELYNEMMKYVKYLNWRVGSGVLEGIISNMNLKQNNLHQPLDWVYVGVSSKPNPNKPATGYEN